MIRKFLLMVSFLALAAQGGTTLAANDNVTIGDDTNRATFKWSGSTLTVTGKGKLEDIKATTGATFTDAAVGNVYENNSSYYTSVTSGEAYNASNTYYGRKAHSAINTGAPADNSFYSVATAVKEGYDVYECEITNNSKSDLSETCIGIKLTEKITDNTTLTSRSDWNYVYKGFAAPKDGHYKYCLVKGNAQIYTDKNNAMYSFWKANLDDNGNYNKDGIEIIALTPENRDSYITFTLTSKSDELYLKTADNTYTQIAKDATHTYKNGEEFYAFSSVCSDGALNASGLSDNDYYTLSGSKMYLKDEYKSYKIWECYYTPGSGDTKSSFTLTSEVTDPTTANNWNNTQSGFKNGEYYYYVLVNTELSSTYSKTFSVSEEEWAAGKHTESIISDEVEFLFLTKSTRSKYFGTSSTLTAKQVFYAKSGATITKVTAGQTYNYNDGDVLYAPAASEYYKLTNDTDIEGTSYLEYSSMTFIEYLNKQLASSPEKVVFNSEDSSTPAEISNAITRTLVKCASITTLNLEDTYLPELKNPDQSKETDPTFYTGDKPGTWEQNVAYNKTLTTLYMPQTKSGSTLYGSYKDGTTNYNYVNRGSLFRYLQNLKTLSLSEGITVMDVYALYESSSPYKLKNVIFPNTLDSIKSFTAYGQEDIETFVFPKSLKFIDTEAFSGTVPKDVYFLGVEAPTVKKFAWGDRNYIANNSLTLSTVTTGTEGHELKVEISRGYATRNTYLTRNGWMTMLHYPAACTPEQAAKYTDITRKYKKIHYDDKENQRTDEGGTTKTYYSPGKETTDLKGTGESSITGNLVAPKEFFNEYPWPNSDPKNPKFAYEYFGGDYNGGFDDIFVGEQYTWPSMSMAQRATIVAQNNKIWDGVTSIGDGIKAAANGSSSYTGDGSEFIGLHQFVFAKNDVTNTDTKKWTLDDKFGDGKWHTICLPISMTKNQMKETFGYTDNDENYNIRLCKFNKVLRIVDSENDRLKLYFNDEQFTDANDNDTVLKAHVSYMIKAEKGNAIKDQKIVMKNYILVGGDAMPTNVNPIINDNQEKDTTSYYFIGNYTKDMRIPQYTYFFSKATGKYRFEMGTSTGTNPTSGKWNAYSSVVEASDGEADYNKFFTTTGSEAKLYTKFEDDGDKGTTGIQKITIEAGGEVVSTNENVYNLNGQLVSTEGLGGLQKGIYILNGKKFIVK